jgi:GNAT superfamily N-acetyltransferase
LITIRNLGMVDVPTANNILVAAFASPRTFDRDLYRYLTFQPDGWFLALDDGKPVGTAGAVDYGPFAYIGLVSVLPDAQRKGIGVALMEHLLTWLDSRGCPMVILDASEAGARMYTRLGFVETDQTLVLRQDGGPEHAATE